MDLLSYQKGDILFSNCQTLVNPVSCDGTIDSYLSKRECKLNCVKLQ